jgi:putative FmdB family regulatory protein
MPIYEYRCLACRRRTSVFVRSVSAVAKPKCEHCGSAKLVRLMSKFAVGRGALDIDDASSMEGIDDNDPRAMARWARQMADEAGEDLGPEFDEMVGRMEAGEMPDDDEMSGFGDDDGGDDGDF